MAADLSGEGSKMNNDIRAALLGDKEVAKRLTDAGVLLPYPYKDGSWQRNPRLYSLWNTMRHRCEDPKRESYQRYGGRGIKVCQEWHDANTFMDWAELHGYKPGLQLDRIDNDGDYSPENCRWVTAKENSRNKRTNRLLTINGKTKTVSEWCEVYDVSPYTVYWWIREKGYKYAEEKVQSRNTRAPILSEAEIQKLEGNT